MHCEDTKTSRFNQYQNSDKAPFVIYADLECIIEKIGECKNNPENSSTTKVSKHILSCFSVSRKSTFRSIENKLEVYRGKDCMEKFCVFLRKQSETINKRAAGIISKCKNLLYL